MMKEMKETTQWLIQQLCLLRNLEESLLLKVWRKTLQFLNLLHARNIYKLKPILFSTSLDSTEPSTTMYSDIEHDGVDMDDVDTTMASPEASPQTSHQKPQLETISLGRIMERRHLDHFQMILQKCHPSSSTQSDVDYTSTSVPISTTSDSNGNLEFIPFGVEDAVVPTGSNDTLLPIIEPTSMDNHGALAHNPNLSLLKPLELKFINGTEEPLLAKGSHETENIDATLPILVERDEDADKDNEKQYQINNSQSISTSLYNNGYYPHGTIIQDDGHHPDELFVEQGELNQREHDNMEHSHTARSTTKRPEQPLKAISSIDKFIPSYSPATVQPGPPKPPSNPSRTYSKFGMQDSPLYRYDHNAPGSSGFGGALIAQGQTPSSIPAPTPTQQVYHHRYYNEPEEIPTSRINNPYNYYNIENKPHRGGGGQGIGMLPQLYKNNNQFFYEDSSAALDSYEDEYESYIQTTGSNTLLPKPTSSTGPHHYVSTKPTSSTPRTKAPISTVPTQSRFLGERVRLPSYNQQRTTSTPKYKYAYISNRPSVQSKLTTERTAITTNADLKQHAPFPFNLPKSQDSSLYNLGIKLSGCNVVGKMYSVGDIIEELSSTCVRCMCSHIGVHCAERSC
ncbi:unnamed protein product [Orchesella dallaii]|uniref:Uncharacterized protein n=1 Tax=Orchesella dallaii TaxID=48710 RepID=A0ABP1Q066_9HEXA